MVPNEFRFHPVGQGLFYSGSINDGKYNFVFDCGAEKEQMYLDREIDKLKDTIQSHYMQSPTLNFVVISHWHTDHFSGLEKLKQKFRIKKLYLPYLNMPHDFALLTFAYSCFVCDNLSLAQGWNQINLMMSYYNQVQSTEDNHRDPNPQEVYFVKGNQYRGDDDTQLNIVPLSPRNTPWNFVFVNKTYNQKKMDKLQKNIERGLAEHGYATITALINALRNEETFDNAKDTLTSIYRETFGTGNPLNATSIVLLHYPTVDHGFPLVRACPHFAKLSHNTYAQGHLSVRGNATLLTGDAMIDAAMERKLVNSYRDLPMGILQVPHHGSWDNYTGGKTSQTPLPLWSQFDIHVIPFGLGNGHGLPDAKTVDYISKSEKYLLYTTQNCGVTYSIEIVH